MTFADRIIHTSHFLSYLIKKSEHLTFKYFTFSMLIYLLERRLYKNTREREREFESLVIKDMHVSNLQFTGIYMELNETPVTDLYSKFFKLLLVSIFHFAGLFTHNLDVHV